MTGSIVFNGGPGGVAKINYQVPMPGSHHGRRLVRLDLGIQDSEWSEAAKTFGEQPGDAAGISASGQTFMIDVAKAREYLRGKLTGVGFKADDVDLALTRLPAVVTGDAQPPRRRQRRDFLLGAAAASRAALLASTSAVGGVDSISTADPDPVPTPTPLPPPTASDRLDEIVDVFVANANRGFVTSILLDSTGQTVLQTSAISVIEEPSLFLVEKLAISSFLGDYGMGRTVRTFTLLPGETTSIRIKTWQSTEESRKQASSIIDSHEQEAQTRFQSEVQSETTDKKTRSSEEKWSVEAEASASWGWGSAKVSGSASGDYQSGREQFSKQVSSAVGEHAAKASSKRQLSVTSESETKTTAGEESVIERTIENVNVRRVLNFVFRELNQQYSTVLHLTDIQVAFTNRRSNSWHIVPVSGLRGLLAELLNAPQDRRDQIASLILKLAGTVIDGQGASVRTLDAIHYDTLTDSITTGPVTMDATGMPTPPTEVDYYRFKPGSLGGQTAVDGVLLSEQTIVMRTDSVLVEALLGESDALDEFAMEVQQASATAQTLANQRERLLQSTLGAITDPAERAKAAAELFRPVKEPS